MNGKTRLWIVVAAVALGAASCKGKMEGKQGPASQEPPARKTVEEALAAIPCPLQARQGVFAVFPDNAGAGQQCFLLTPDSGGKEIPPFDIQTGGMTLAIHGPKTQNPDEFKLTRWRAKDGKPCFEDACRSEVPTSSEAYDDPKDPAFNFVLLTPTEPVDMAIARDFYGLVTGPPDAPARHIPIFH